MIFSFYEQILSLLFDTLNCAINLD